MLFTSSLDTNPKQDNLLPTKLSKFGKVVVTLSRCCLMSEILLMKYKLNFSAVSLAEEMPILTLDFILPQRLLTKPKRVFDEVVSEIFFSL